MKAGRMITVIVGALLTTAGLGAVASGGALAVVHATQRDDAGFYHTRTESLETPTAALVARVDLGSVDATWDQDHPLGTVRIDARSADPRPLFVGIGPAAEVDVWLSGTRYTEVTGADVGPFHTRTLTVDGDRAITAPARQTFWVASASGAGAQSALWPSQSGEWVVVVMNADARPGVAADVSAGTDTGLLWPAGLVLGAIGLVLLGAGIAIMLAAVGRTSSHADVVVATRHGAYPVRLDARLEPGLSRWWWLVKWLLALPHAVVLALLWLAVVPLTALAGVAILVTGRYPRSIFDFNVGVMRWTWRVSCYAFGPLGTDRYPPFSLDSDPTYPADLSVDYPQRLSRGLVLVKWWLLAIPHYAVVALFAGGWSGGFGQAGENWRLAAGGGLIGILVLVAVVMLAVTGAYPPAIFDFVMGMSRWCYRVLAYAGLMRDEYPPFRLDTGGTDPGTVAAPPTPSPDRDGELVGAASDRS